MDGVGAIRTWGVAPGQVQEGPSGRSQGGLSISTHSALQAGEWGNEAQARAKRRGGPGSGGRPNMWPKAREGVWTSRMCGGRAVPPLLEAEGLKGLCLRPTVVEGDSVLCGGCGM